MRTLVGGLTVAAAVVAVIAFVAVNGSGSGTVSSTTVAVLPPTVPAGADGDVWDGALPRGEWLRPGDAVRDPTGVHQLEMTDEGRLQLRSGGRIVWTPSYDEVPTAAAVLTDDGELVVYRRVGTTGDDALWSSNAGGTDPDPVLTVGVDDGGAFVAIVGGDGVVRWRAPNPTP